MQVVCQSSPSSASSDVLCPVCSQGFLLSWERTCPDEQRETLGGIQQALTDHHSMLAEGDSDANEVHPAGAFNIPEWSGSAEFSGAAMLGGLPSASR